ncbi:hypothetical protein CVT24_010031 [Panaeolus cyanescens]|uniref:Pescadillo homolog n=1 Tax=Panaeolus cyanescens TaxID=181874 RepID=A0A409W3Z3_9AGAR|nr:hypothetical protein CVT24_010031 [Panaeolus cyanescens]
MGRLKQKGKAGAAKNYTTRSAAVKKLQCSLADFRRLCILKGIFPREPRNRKKANKGSSAPTSFYYTKDIAYLAHEPILKKLREHKAFAKKLSRALGRGEWASAKSLEENKPIYKLDHIIKERYPTFIDALRDIDDALCMAFLFSSLPSSARLPPELVENCARLSAEWQLYTLHTQALRKAFLSIKGVYYQAEVMGETITWLVPYQFTQNVPTDVDIRVMLTFLELYQTLLSFVFFKLYTDSGLVYPPPLDAKKDEGAAGLAALSLQNISRTVPAQTTTTPVVNGRQITGKDVRQTIKAISTDVSMDVSEVQAPLPEEQSDVQEEDFVVHTSKSDPNATSLPTLQSLSSLPGTLSTNLFSPYTFFLSREISRPIFEFILKCFGGRVGWPASSGGGSPFTDSDPSITHVIIDRPVVEKEESADQRELRRRRKYVQPQWVVDCINAGKILLEDNYAQGKSLPPHLSPFGEYEGAYVPMEGGDVSMSAEQDNEEEDEEMEEDNTADGGIDAALSAEVETTAMLRAAELAAEAAGIDSSTFEARVEQIKKKQPQQSQKAKTDDQEEDMNKMMMSNKQRKLYEKVKHGQQKRVNERLKLENRRKELNKKQS